MSDEALKRYRVSYRNGVIEEDGSPRSCGDSYPMYLASDADHLISSLRQELAKLNKNRCQHCDAQAVESFPHGCPGCGAPICCQRCCREQNMEMNVEGLRQELKEARENERRYKWLRDRWFIAGEAFPDELHEGVPSATHFDDAIDAALASEQRGTE